RVAIACSTVSGLGASDGPHAWVLVGSGPGGLQPQPMANIPMAIETAVKRISRMPPSLRTVRAGPVPQHRRSPGGEFLLAVHPLQQRGIRVDLGADGLAVADGEN